MKVAVSREGNAVPGMSCQLRKLVMGSSDSLCGKCVHMLDTCKGVNRETALGAFLCVRKCEGFEEVK